MVIATRPPFPFRRSRHDGLFTRLGAEKSSGPTPCVSSWMGLLVAGGSDSSVMPADYMLGIHSAVNHPFPDQR